MLYGKLYLKYIIFGSGCCIDTFISMESEYYTSEKLILEKTSSINDAEIIFVYGCLNSNAFQMIKNEFLNTNKVKIFLGNFTFVDESIKDEILKSFDYTIIGCPVDCLNLIKFLEEEFYERKFLL
ncbi:MAG: hypothetical protein ABIN39_05525 [candidate division WOR-3 bacterium]